MFSVIRPCDDHHRVEGWRRCLGRRAGFTFALVTTHSQQLLERVLDELHGDPRIDAGKIAVLAGYDGTVSLSGSVRSYAEKCWSEELVRRVPGVSAVANDLVVRLTIGDYRTDAMLHRIVTDVLDALCAMPDVRPAVSVQDGWLTLSGVVDWPFQKQASEESIRQIAGIRGITNEIRIEPRWPARARPGVLAGP
jgi:osmotically-inducible protein OsmY